ncbi:1,2-phenylacetyl-CoA epoxidase subunit PaaD [Rathayibacter sp. KR2-224]|uniref:1,2-phenylacetyl-CoA epoxidase subunit PaaD n=1 Tax=Rathayibacter sp. KR2-224 TaxID=3400913 RepID=UPI003C007A81
MVMESADAAERREPVDSAERRAWALAAEVCDPEVPVLTIEDLGVLRSVRVVGDGEAATVRVEITPTYSGCPAVDAIRDDIVSALAAAGYPRVEVRTVLAPAWTTDWMSDSAKAKLEAFGIAPPAARSEGRVGLGLGIRCPHCGSLHTREVSRFGSTSCKALYVCQRCGEPFDHFKAH